MPIRLLGAGGTVRAILRFTLLLVFCVGFAVGWQYDRPQISYSDGIFGGRWIGIGSGSVNRRESQPTGRLVFPGDQIEALDLGTPQRAAFSDIEKLSSIYGGPNNFERLSNFPEGATARKLSMGVGRLDILVKDHSPDIGQVFPCTGFLISSEYILNRWTLLFRSRKTCCRQRTAK